VSVPSVRHMTLQEATDALAQAGLVVGRVEYDEALDGGVFSQNPPANAQSARGTAVNLVIGGLQPVAVPDLVGLSQAKAETLLVARGFTVGSIAGRHSATAPKGEVVTQTPSPDFETTPGIPVDIVVSSGPARIAVLSVLGLAESTAWRRLRSAGFSVAIRHAPSHKKKGTVAAQSPSHGSALPGSTVRLTISSGPPASSAPPAPSAPAPVARFKAILRIWDVNSRGVSDPRTGYAWVDILSLQGMRVRARCSFRLAEGSRVWVARTAGGGWIVTGPR
jgi:beta-lactam-binding protein with PASTA domain